MSWKKEQVIFIFLCLVCNEVYSQGCPFQESKLFQSDAPTNTQKLTEPNYRDLLHKGRQVTPNSFKMSRRNKYFDTKLGSLRDKGYSTDEAFIKAKEFLNDGELEVDTCLGIAPDCDPSSKYRTISGLCNNPKNPLYGSRGYKLQRFLPPKYEDEEYNPTANGKFEAKEGCDPSGPLPNARKVSSMFHQDANIPSSIASTMVAQWGMFVAHDLSFVPNSHEANCCNGIKDKNCFPLRILDDDDFYSNFNVTCLDFYRSVRYCSSRPREQYNDITSFIDASNVYGSSEAELQKLKESNSSLLKVTITDSGKELLPKDCSGSYAAGDSRASLISGLASVHTIFVREHNRIARLLTEKYPSAKSDIIFEETRRIIGAIMQNIIYREYLPSLLGEKAMKKFNLYPKYPSTYNPDVNPNVASVFVAAAFRFGHSMIRGDVNRLAMNKNGISLSFSLLDDFFDMSNYEDIGGQGMEEVIYGLSSFKAQSADRFVVKEVTNYLFNNKKPYGSDLEAKTILRGRDHGLPPYGDWRKFCGLKPICSWNDRPKEISKQNWSILKKLYSSPNDIDIHAAGLAENPIPGTVLGPTNNCIISRQLKALKDGDRFYFTHKDEAGSFTSEQVHSIFKTSLSRIICDNTDIEYINENVFRIDSEFISCSDIPKLDITLF